MPANRSYLPEVETAANSIPMLDISDVPGARETVRKFVEELAQQGIERPSDSNVIESEAAVPAAADHPAIPVRIYRHRAGPDPAPLVLNFHAGGFVLGDLESEHLRCLTICRDTRATIIGVDYRLAPEHPYPAGVEDCYAALVWAIANAETLGFDGTRVAVCGGSAGGALSAAVCLMARDRRGPDIAAQMLLYPVTDDACDTTSLRGGDDCYIWNRQNCADMWDQYLGRGRDIAPPYAAPARAADLSRLPPALVVTCEHDPLRDEGILFAMRLMNAGVPVELHNFAGTVHAFDMLVPGPLSERALADQCAFVSRSLVCDQT